MKKHTTLLTALAICMASAAWAANAFTVNVMVGSPSGNPSLVFGQQSTAVQNAFPPFSSMFGVKDIYLANPANFGETAEVFGDFSRLGTDIRTLSDDNAWVLMAGSDATAYFQFAEGNATLYVAEADQETKLLGDSLSLKAGVCYTISARSTTRAVVPAVDPSSQTAYLEADASTGLYEGKAAVEKLGSVTAATLYLVSGDGPVYLCDGVNYYANNGTSATTAPEAGWVLALDASSIAYSGDTAIVNFASATDKLDLSATATKAYKPISTTVCVNDVHIGTVNWIIKSSGTLDFNDDGALSNVDKYLLANFIAAFNASEGVLEDITPEDVQGTQKSLKDVDADAALTLLLQDASANLLDFNDDGALSNVDKYLLANFIAAFNASEGVLEDITVEDVQGTQKSLKNVDAASALERLKALAGSIAK